MPSRRISRPEDMSPNGHLTLMQQEGGDIVVIVEEAYRLPSGTVVRRSTAVEFCLSATRSPWTTEALRGLMVAMERDQRGEQWPAAAQGDGNAE